jgi:hypothetical protein
MTAMLAASVSYMSSNPGNTVPLDCSRYSYYDECDVFYNNVTECEEPCSVFDSSSSFSDSMSKFGNYLGLAMDAVLCFHCFKNYKDIYPSVFSLLMLWVVAGVQGSIKFDSLEDARLFSLVVLVITLIIMCRYCYAGCNMGAACCKGGGLKYQYTCLGVGM